MRLHHLIVLALVLVHAHAVAQTSRPSLDRLRRQLAGEDVDARTAAARRLLADDREDARRLLHDFLWERAETAVLDGASPLTPSSPPDAIRFWVAALYHPEPPLRRAAIRRLRDVKLPYLVGQRYDAKRAELQGEFGDVDHDLVAEHLAAILRHRANVSELTLGARLSLRDGRPTPEAEAIYRRAVEGMAGTTFLPAGERVAGEPYAAAAFVPAPERRRLPQVTGPGSVIVGYRLTGDGFEASLKGPGASLRGITFPPGASMLGYSDRLCVVALRPRARLDYEISFPAEAVASGRFRLHGMVLCEPSRAGPRMQSLAVRAPAPWLADHPGFDAADSRLPALRAETDRASLSFEVSKGVDARALFLDHWSPDASGSRWELRLDGQPLMILVSQPLPRPARPARAVILHPGRHRLDFRRIQGGPLYVEALRLLR